MNLTEKEIKEIVHSESVQVLASQAALRRLLIAKGIITPEELETTGKVALIKVASAIIDGLDDPDGEATASHTIHTWICVGDPQ